VLHGYKQVRNKFWPRFNVMEVKYFENDIDNPWKYGASD
jgi:hypothetical protein